MRLFIYPKDIQIVMGRKKRYCEKLYNQLIDAHGKTREKGLTIKEFCRYFGLVEEDIYAALNIK
jgi:hypothetical protein